MVENPAYDGAVQETLFAVYSELPWLLHLSGELDLCGAPALTTALEGPIKVGGAIGLDLAGLSYMDSTGVHVILNTVRSLGERGRLVLFNPSPLVRRLIEVCGLVGMIDINDDHSPTRHLDQPSGDSCSPVLGRQGQPFEKREERPIHG